MASPLSTVEMRPGIGKCKVQPRLVEVSWEWWPPQCLPSGMGSHRSWQCHHLVDPDGDALRGKPTTEVCACVHWGMGREGRGICQCGKGLRVGRVRRVNLFGFWLMLKNVKDPTDRHWNMIFFSGKLTDRMERKTTWMPSPPRLKLPPSHRGEEADSRAEGDGAEEGLLRVELGKKKKEEKKGLAHPSNGGEVQGTKSPYPVPLNSPQAGGGGIKARPPALSGRAGGGGGTHGRDTFC